MADKSAESQFSNAFEVFPPELWENILKNVDDPQVFDNVSKQLPEVAGMIKENKANWISPKMLPIVLASQYLTEEEIFKCRRVSRAWKRATDNWLIRTLGVWVNTLFSVSNLRRRSVPPPPPRIGQSIRPSVHMYPDAIQIAAMDTANLEDEGRQVDYFCAMLLVFHRHHR